MGKTWNGQDYNMDFYPIDAMGNVVGPKDEAASTAWTNANEPWRNSPGWHAQPLSAMQEAGLQQTNPQAYAERQAWRSANPTNAIGGPLRGGSWRPLPLPAVTRRAARPRRPMMNPMQAKLQAVLR